LAGRFALDDDALVGTLERCSWMWSLRRDVPADVIAVVTAREDVR